LALHDAAAGHASQMSKKTCKLPQSFSYNLAEIVVLQVSRKILILICIFPKSNSTSALDSKFWMKKTQNMLVWLSRIVLTQHSCTGCRGWQKAWRSLTPAVDWLDGLIAPDEMLFSGLSL
jgi:hypothetical protein